MLDLLLHDKRPHNGILVRCRLTTVSARRCLRRAFCAPQPKSGRRWKPAAQQQRDSCVCGGAAAQDIEHILKPAGNLVPRYGCVSGRPFGKSSRVLALAVALEQRNCRFNQCSALGAPSMQTAVRLGRVGAEFPLLGAGEDMFRGCFRCGLWLCRTPDTFTHLRQLG